MVVTDITRIAFVCDNRAFVVRLNVTSLDRRNPPSIQWRAGSS